ncbi:peptidase M20 [Gordoniibacillus kamchatkensis]|uniref:Peptidase M20 n=1 Tax=Gordoniibacillus kamchatkensis TaxID=1590651 RepID=A0ABR5AJG5_9BACL|nr:M20 family metallopeptidase [Paenibacillus sp. VKM B-2647]KIL41154.1 peptidase M20 [Paenibacillus sp. VKM B-2647]
MDGLEERLDELFPDIVGWRRYLHRNPELSFHEERTAAFVAEKLEAWGIEVRRGVGGHGLVGTLRGGKPGRTAALRADMDALPIQDEKSCDYRSTVPGVMHACGHDAHTATLLGVAKALAEKRDRLQGNIVFLFQHAEEMNPGGAKSMIEAGALEGVDAAYGVHLWTPFPAGHVYCRPGPLMAAPDEFVLDIIGKGGHGGLPHQTVDSIVIGAELVGALQTVVSRNIDPIEPCVVSVGSFHAGTSFNVIAETCAMKGTVRSFDAGVRMEAKRRIEELVRHTCEMHGASYRLEYKLGYPPVVNHAADYDRFRRIGEALFGRERVHESPPIMAGEDFAYYLQKVPGCFMFVGAGNAAEGIVHPHHHPRFDIDEQAMRTAASLLAAMALDAAGAAEAV